MSARRFLAVPTSALFVDPDVSSQSPKGYTPQQLQEIAATVPAIYDQIADGRTEQDFLDMRLSTDPKARAMGDTYNHLFRDSPSSAPLAASYDGTDLIVDKGNHRVRAAREIGVPVVPVWVHAPTEADLDRVENACNRRLEREGATTYRDAHTAHETRVAYERPAGRERMRGEHVERDWQFPERER